MTDARVPGDTDPVSALAGVLSAMGKSTRGQVQRLKQTERNRFNLLVVHAIAALVIPPLFVASSGGFTGPTWDFLRQVPFFPISFILPLWIGGLILLPATYGRNTRREEIGLWFIYLWYAALAVGFGWPALVWCWNAAWSWLFDGPWPTRKPSLYAPVVYLHLAVIMRVHIFTLRKFKRRPNSDNSFQVGE